MANNITTEIKNCLKTNKEKKFYFVKWYVDTPTKDRTKENYNKNCKNNSIVEFETVMGTWLCEDDVQITIKEYMKKQKNIKMLNMYDAMYEKALNGDVKSAEWVEKFYKSDFFENEEDEIDDYLSGINIPGLGDKKWE